MDPDEEPDRDDDPDDDPEKPPSAAEGFDPEAPEHREVATEAAVERSDFLGLMGHLYRGEMGRTTSWRRRLDRTSNWSVVITATLLTWAFSTDKSPHGVILVGMVMVTVFLFFEARRYRMYDVWRSRVRMLEENVFANALNPEGAAHPEWRKLMSEDLRRPAIKMSSIEALGRRLRRIYLPLLMILLVSWVVQLSILAPTRGEMIHAAHIWILSGPVTIAVVTGFYVILLLTAFWPRERQAKGEMVKGIEHQGRWKNGD